MAINSGFSHEKWWFSIVRLVYQRVDSRLVRLVFDSSWNVHRRTFCQVFNVRFEGNKLLTRIRREGSLTEGLVDAWCSMEHCGLERVWKSEGAARRLHSRTVKHGEASQLFFGMAWCGSLAFPRPIWCSKCSVPSVASSKQKAVTCSDHFQVLRHDREFAADLRKMWLSSQCCCNPWGLDWSWLSVSFFPRAPAKGSS